MTTKHLNNIDMNKIVNLRNEQSLEYLEFEEIKSVNDIKVGNLINGHQFPEVFENTVMVNLSNTHT